MTPFRRGKIRARQPETFHTSSSTECPSPLRETTDRFSRSLWHSLSQPEHSAAAVVPQSDSPEDVVVVSLEESPSSSCSSASCSSLTDRQEQLWMHYRSHPSHEGRKQRPSVFRRRHQRRQLLPEEPVPALLDLQQTSSLGSSSSEWTEDKDTTSEMDHSSTTTSQEIATCGSLEVFSEEEDHHDDQARWSYTSIDDEIPRLLRQDRWMDTPLIVSPAPKEVFDVPVDEEPTAPISEHRRTLAATAWNVIHELDSIFGP